MTGGADRRAPSARNDDVPSPMRRCARALVVAALIVAAAHSPAPAFHANTLPLVESFDSFERGWVSWSVATGGDQVALDIETNDVGSAFMIGVAEYTVSGAWIQTSRLSGFPGKDGTLVEANAAGVHYREDTMNRDSSLTRVALGKRINPPGSPPFTGTRKVLAWWASDATTWTVSLRAGPGATVLGRESGASAFFYRAHDFTSAAHVQAWRSQRVEPYTIGAGARVQAGGALALDVRDTLVLGITSELLAPGVVTISSPTGERLCGLEEFGGSPIPFETGVVSSRECESYQMSGPGRSGPGSYVVRVSGVGLVDYFYGEVYLGGADARLPA